MLAARAAQKIALDQCLLNRMGMLAGFPNRVAMDGSILTMQGAEVRRQSLGLAPGLVRLPSAVAGLSLETASPRRILTQSHSCAH